MIKKRCSSCKKLRPIEQFHKRKNAKDGRHGVCTSCRVAYVRQWKADHKEQHLSTNRIWRRTLVGFFHQKMGQLRRRHSRKDLEVKINATWLSELYQSQKGLCAITGRNMLINAGSSCVLDALSIDRIKSSKGYIPGNVRLVILQANSARMNGSDDQLREFCKDVLKWLGP